MILNKIDRNEEERKQLAELLFEQQNCPASYFISKHVCSLFSSGRQSGVVVDIGAYNT